MPLGLCCGHRLSHWDAQPQISLLLVATLRVKFKRKREKEFLTSLANIDRLQREFRVRSSSNKSSQQKLKRRFWTLKLLLKRAEIFLCLSAKRASVEIEELCWKTPKRIQRVEVFNKKWIKMFIKERNRRSVYSLKLCKRGVKVQGEKRHEKQRLWKREALKTEDIESERDFNNREGCVEGRGEFR